MSEGVEVFVSLLDARQIETWQFEPGDAVVCELIASGDGYILAATGPDR